MPHPKGNEFLLSLSKMLTNHGRHLVKPQSLHPSAKKTVYPLPQQLAEKVIKDKGRNAYVVVFDSDEPRENSALIHQKRVLKTSSRVFNEQNAAQTGDEQKQFRNKPNSSEYVKINFSNLAFEEYDSSKTAVNVFKDDDIDTEIDTCFIKQEIDEGYGESSCSFLPQQVGKSNEPIAGYMLITSPSDSVQFYKPDTSTSPSKYDLSGSSGYFSAGSSSLLSEFNTPSPVPTQGHPVARQIILVPSPDMNIDGRHVFPHQFSKVSPMSSLATGLQNIARIQSPTVFSTRKLTGADAFSLPEDSQPKNDDNLHKDVNISNKAPSATVTNSTRTTTSTPPFQWEQVENRIVIQAPNKKPLDLSLPNLHNINSLKGHSSQTNSSNTTSSPAPLNMKADRSCKIGDVLFQCDIKQKETVVMVQQGDSCSYNIEHLPVSSTQEPTTYVHGKSASTESSSVPICKQEPDDIWTSQDSSCLTYSQESFGLGSSQESNELTVGTDKECLDTSLTNIQWLGGIQLKKDPAKPTYNSVPIQWKRMSIDDIIRVAAECGKSKRPPFSYMTLIQMALYSKEDKRMRLRDICAWIENIFPYYKHTAKPGWKNSIRHNLSLYSIFERETTKKHGSYWTVREDCPEKLRSCPGRDSKKDDLNKANTPNPFPAAIIPSFLPPTTNTASTTCTGSTQGRKRAGPQPILPRPSPLNNAPLQTYALIPIQNVGNSSRQSPNVVMPMSSSQESSSSTASESSQNDSNKGLKTRKIVPKLSPALMLSPPNIVKQAWLDSQFVSGNEGDGERNKNLYDSSKSDNESCPKKAKTGLPQPKIYSKNTPPVKRTKSRRKQKLIPKERELMQDSSDEESEYAKFVSRLEEDLPTPMRNLLDENTVKNDESSAITSTPLKDSVLISQMPSPFSGLTPLKTENILDNSFLECLKDSPQMTAKKSPSSSGSSPKLDLNFIGLTPIKVNNGSLNHDNSYNLSKFLAEYPIDANMMEEADVLQVDLSALNWSSVQNMVSLDNS